MADPSMISWLTYGWEASYATVTSTADKVFGEGQKISNLTRRNNIEKVFACGSRNAQKQVAKAYEGSISVESNLANPWFFRALLGAHTTTGAGPYTHTFSEADEIESISIFNNVQSDTASVSKLLGCKIATCTLNNSVGELTRVKLDMAYANETLTSTTTSKVSESFDLYTFAQATLELPTSSTLALIQNCELTIANNPEMLWGLGSRFGQAQPVKQREYSCRIGQAFQSSSDLLTKLYGASTGANSTVSEAATLKFTYTNGLTSTNARSITLTFTGVQIDEESMPQDPTQAIIEDVTLTMRSLSCVAIDNTSTIP